MWTLSNKERNAVQKQIGRSHTHCAFLRNQSGWQASCAARETGVVDDWGGRKLIRGERQMGKVEDSGYSFETRRKEAAS